MQGSYTFDPVFSSTHPWPQDIPSCMQKFQAYNDRMKKLFEKGDRKADNPQIVSWALTTNKTYESACLLWDIIHVYHHIGVLHWGQSFADLQTKQDHKQAKAGFLEAYKYFNAISKHVLTRWVPACRVAYEITKGVRKLVFPPFLVGDNWKPLATLCLALAQRCSLEKAIEMKSSDTLLMKLAVHGYNLLDSEVPNLHPPALKTFYMDQKRAFQWHTLLYWARQQGNAEETGDKIKILQDMQAEMKKIKKNEWIDPKLIDEELTRWISLNDSVYYKTIPTESKVKEILSKLDSHDLVGKIIQEIECCVLYVSFLFFLDMEGLPSNKNFL